MEVVRSGLRDRPKLSKDGRLVKDASLLEMLDLRPAILAVKKVGKQSYNKLRVSLSVAVLSV